MVQRGVLALFVSILIFSADSQSASAQPAAMRGLVQWEPEKLVPGSPVLFKVPASKKIQDVSAHWFGHELRFFLAADASGWYALAAVPIVTNPGSYELSISETLATGKSVEIRKMIRIARAVYPKITAKVAKRFTEPDPEQLKEINADKNIKQQTFANVTPQKLWEGSFVAPVAAPVSDIFGTARVFNGAVLSRHQGLDFGVGTGTPVAAINRGTVLLARPLYFEGNCVVVDHGQGLLSLYLHLSEFKVREGDEVQSHQIIGLSGGSGRATGPHLHLAVRWQGVYLDPATLLKLKIP